MHAGALHAGELADGAGQFALQRAGVVDLLHKVGLTDLDLVEDLKADALPHQTASSGNLDALVVDHFLRHHDGGAVVGKFIRNLFRFEHTEDAVGVLAAQVGIQDAVVGARGVDGQANDGRQQHHGTTGGEHPLRGAHVGPRVLETIHGIVKGGWHRHNELPYSCVRRSRTADGPLYAIRMPIFLII